MRGTIFINADAARALRKAPAAVLATDVLDCVGGFDAGDKVYVVVRGKDGGQGVLATGVVACDQATLSRVKGRRVAANEDPDGGDSPLVVIPVEALALLWPRKR